MKKVLLLDIENLHQTEKQLFQYLKQYQQVYLVYAKSPVNFSLDALVLLSPYVVNGKLKVLKMPKIGKMRQILGWHLLQVSCQHN